MSSGAVYVTRNNVLTSESRWEITSEGVCLSQLSGTQTINWGNIREIRLLYAPTRYVANRYTCAINLHSGGTLWFSSHYYVGFTNFRNEGLAYAQFVEKLIKVTAEKCPSCRFTSGAGVLSYLLNLVVMIFTVFVLFVIAGLLMSLGLTWVVAIKLIVIIFLIPRALRWLKYNRGQSFNSNNIPTGLLPPR